MGKFSFSYSYGTQNKECTSLDGTIKGRETMWAVFTLL